MKYFRAVKSLRKFLDVQRQKSKTIGFVPTMGALHKGHLSLIDQSNTHTDFTVCSIFVNPTQFNTTEDLIKYPRTFNRDKQLLKSALCDLVFKPTVPEMYPTNIDTFFEIDLNGLDQVMEGEHRPGHFKGVVQVVKRLLDIVEPDKLFMGQKDYQQCAIIRRLLQITQSKTQLVICPIIREKNGLAMSSRNVRLTKEQRDKAQIIHQTLKWAKSEIYLMDPLEISSLAMKKMTTGDFKAEYVSIADGESLKKIKSVDAHDSIVICTAVWAGNIRLIDNIYLELR